MVIFLTFRVALILVLSVISLFADNILLPGVPVLDRSTLTTLGVRLPITGDDNFNAAVGVRYRLTGTTTWRTGAPLFRVHPETVAAYTVAPQFSGSIFDLKPGATYDIELHAVDPDGTDQTFTLTSSTRSVPGDPATPSVKNVSDASGFQAALDAAQPGDVITLANGVYPGQFFTGASGTAANPIVIRGASQDGVIIDGSNCTGCNVIEVYGAGYIHIENLTIQNAERAIRFQSNGATANVVRRVHIKNTGLGIGGKWTQYDFYIADNILEGRLLWPHVYWDDGGAYSDQDGIAISGFGHVVAHNRISGFGDAMKTILDGARANDFYGNDVVYTYDNGVELDGSEGNARVFRNRFMNSYSPLSVQPIHGGPAYLLRNVVVNVVDEQMKFHSRANPEQDPSGVLAYHNTFVSPVGPELNMQTVVPSHYFAIENNLFIAAAGGSGAVVDWLGVNDHGIFDYNGYFPDGPMEFHPPSGYLDVSNFAGLAGTGYETHGLVANGVLFANGLTGPASYITQMAPADATLAGGSVAQDKGLILPGINDNYTGSAPDLGALETGCPNPGYGPRAVGVDETNEIVGCTASSSVTSVAVLPLSATVRPGAAQQFTATTTPPGGTVTWSLFPTRGTLSPSGLYTASPYALLGQVVTVTATSTTNPLASASAKVYLSNTVNVSVSPGSITVTQPLGRVEFSAAVAGALNASVTWSVKPALGWIGSTGLYTAPHVINGTQLVSVTATSVADPTKSASATVTLTPAPPIAVTPNAVTVHSGTTQTFTTAVPGGNNAVTWSVTPARGTISAAGVYQAPAIVTAPETVSVVATSVASPWIKGKSVITLVP